MTFYSPMHLNRVNIYHRIEKNTNKERDDFKLKIKQQDNELSNREISWEGLS